MSDVSPELLEILACPKCKAPVKERDGRLHCTGNDCGLVYPIREGIPVMLIDEAESPSQVHTPE